MIEAERLLLTKDIRTLRLQVQKGTVNDAEFVKASEGLMARLRSYAAALGQECDEDELYQVIVWEMDSIMSRMRVREEIITNCSHQPAGTPTFLDVSEGLEPMLARGYAEKIKKRPRFKMKPEDRKKHREELKQYKQSREDRERGFVPPLKKKRRFRDYDDRMYEDWRFFHLGRANKKGYRIRRTLYSERLGCNIMIMEHIQTKKCIAQLVRADFREDGFKANLYINTWTAAKAYKLEAEQRALELLKSKVRPDQFSRYFCTGFLVERSKKSNLIYIFRRLRPILVYREKPAQRKGYVQYELVGALCIHAQGYYSGSWAGTLVPTDDVVAQLLMMRSDEKGLWRKANNHVRDHHVSTMADV